MNLLSKWSFARLGKLVGGIADRAGLTASIESHCQRFACVAANDVIAAEPPPGTPLLVDLFGIVEHSGIYLGNGTVAELYGDDLMREVSLCEFLTGSPCGARSVRTGAHVFAACDKSSGDVLWSRVAMDNAKAFIRRIRTVKYKLLRNNCHLFSISCISGKFNPGLSVSEGLHLGGMSVGVLTAAIGHFMNYGKEVVWRPVRGWDRKSLGAAEGEQLDESDAACSQVLVRYAADVESKRADPAFYTRRCEKIIGKESGKGGIFAPVCAYLRMAAATVGDALAKRRNDIPWTQVAGTMAALLYVISPIDLVPDFIPGLGFADDALVFLKAFANIVQYVSIPSSVSSTLLRIEPQTMNWICGLGSCPGAFAAEVFASEPSREFCITLSQVSYYCDRFGLTSPLKRGIGGVAADAVADALWRDECAPSACGWKVQSSTFGFRMADYEGAVGFFGKEDEVRAKFAEFCAWIDTALLPAILNERV